MEQEIILEGIHAMLEEIRDNMKKNPEQEMISLKLAAIEKVCNDLAEKKLVTEDLMAGFISYVLKQMIEMDKKQDEKLKEILDRFEQQNTQRPPQKHLHSIDIKSSKVVVTLVGLSLFLFLSSVGNLYQWKENTKLFNNDIKYRYIKARQGIDSKDLHSLENIFVYEPDKAKQKSLRQSVEDFERRVHERSVELERVRNEKQLFREAKIGER